MGMIGNRRNRIFSTESSRNRCRVVSVIVTEWEENAHAVIFNISVQLRLILRSRSPIPPPGEGTHAFLVPVLTDAIKTFPMLLSYEK